MKLKAKDTLHVSSVQCDPIRPGETFTVSDAEGKSLIDRGLVTRVAESAKKKAAAPQNKMQPVTLNKAAAPAKGAKVKKVSKSG